MGSIIIKKVIYSGDSYFYNSPELNEGINIILGDNGSGKSTFSYFIEYGLGGKIKPFMDDDDARYSIILEDKNNYVHLDILINKIPYSLKRFINSHDIFIDDGSKIELLPLNRHKVTSPFIFSDWLLDKLGIPVFEMYIGITHWYFNFNDLFRLLNYDQNTETKRIYKDPLAENFVADSIVIRKSIFEILLGISSAEYFKKLDEAKAAMKARDAAKNLWESFTSNHEVAGEFKTLNEQKAITSRTLIELEAERNTYLKQHTSVDDKLGELSQIQSNLVDNELLASKDRLSLANLVNEQNKVSVLYEGLVQEINQIEKIIFTHDKLDLFAMEICPFCMSKKDPEKGYCICGSKFTDDDYEKFVYNSSEYKDILSHKQKSIKAITLAKETYEEEVKTIKDRLDNTNARIAGYTEQLKTVITTAEFAGNNTVVDNLNDRIFKLKDELLKINFGLKNSEQEQQLKTDLDKKNTAFATAQRALNAAKFAYDQNNASTIEQFNEIYSTLLAKSSYKSTSAYIDEDYMPFIDNREYKANSSEVPKRLMYYFTILSLALKLDSVKHPKFLLIDTPEDSGIDTDNLNLNLSLLEEAITIGSKVNEVSKDFQVILTTGYGKFPEEFDKYIIERFSEKDGNFILKPKATKDQQPEVS